MTGKPARRVMRGYLHPPRDHGAPAFTHRAGAHSALASQTCQPPSTRGRPDLDCHVDDPTTEPGGIGGGHLGEGQSKDHREPHMFTSIRATSNANLVIPF